MKDLVRLPSVFLLTLILLFLAFAALSFLAAWGTLLPVDPAQRGQALATALAELPRLARNVLPVSVLGALLVLMMRIARRPGSRLLSVVVPPVCAFLLLVLGYQGLYLLETVWPQRSEPAEVALYLAPGLFVQAGPDVIYSQSQQAREVTGIVVWGAAEKAPRLSYAARGELQVGEDTVGLRAPGVALQWPRQPVYAPLFEAGPPLRSFFSQLGVVNEELSRQHREARGVFLLTCLALAVGGSGAGVLLRVSRWYLLNACLTLLAFRGLLALFSVLRQDGGGALGKALGGGAILQALPAVGLLLAGALLLLLDLLVVPFDRQGEGLTGA